MPTIYTSNEAEPGNYTVVDYPPGYPPTVNFVKMDGYWVTTTPSPAGGFETKETLINEGISGSASIVEMSDEELANPNKPIRRKKYKTDVSFEYDSELDDIVLPSVIPWNRIGFLPVFEVETWTYHFERDNNGYRTGNVILDEQIKYQVNAHGIISLSQCPSLRVYEPASNQIPFVGTVNGNTITFPARVYAHANDTLSVPSYLEWNWGDGVVDQIPLATDGSSIGSVQTAFSHTYTLDGQNNGSGSPISFRAIDGLGRKSRPVVYRVPPRASFEAQDIYAQTEDEADERKFSFDATASSDLDGTIVQFKWEFGDGQTLVGNASTARSVQHIYAPAEDEWEYNYDLTRVFYVQLTVTDNDGLTDTITRQVDVKDAALSEQCDALVLADGRVVTCTQDGKDVVTRVFFPTATALKQLEQSRVTGAKIGAVAAKPDATLVRTLRRNTAIEMETSKDGGKTWQ